MCLQNKWQYMHLNSFLTNPKFCPESGVKQTLTPLCFLHWQSILTPKLSRKFYHANFHHLSKGWMIIAPSFYFYEALLFRDMIWTPNNTILSTFPQLTNSQAPPWFGFALATITTAPYSLWNKWWYACSFWLMIIFHLFALPKEKMKLGGFRMRVVWFQMSLLIEDAKPVWHSLCYGKLNPSQILVVEIGVKLQNYLYYIF